MERIHTYDESEVTFHNFDAHVSKIQATDMTSVATLIEYFKEPIIENKYKEIFIARACLVWMTHMKTNEMKDLPGELDAILNDHPTIVFTTLCKSANIQHHIIYGIGKNIGYIPGQTEDDDSIIKTAWVAFKSQYRWHLVDPQRFLGAVKGFRRGEEILLEHQGETVFEEQIATSGTKLIYVNDFWFCLHPSIFIINCFPDDPEWQLLPLEKRTTKSDFFSFAYLRPDFFTAKLQLLSEQTCVLHTKNGRYTISFGANKSSARYISMFYKLSIRKGTVDLTGLDVQDLPLLVMYAPSIDTFSFNIRFPVAAEYIFGTYVSAPGIDGDSYNICSEFKIICSEPDPNCKKLPLDVGSTGYGFGYAAVDLGLKNPSTPQPIVALKGKQNDDMEMTELTFQIEDDKINEVEFSSDIAGEENEENVVMETSVDEVSGKLHVKAGIKKEGEYALSIIARDKQTDQYYRRIINYLLTTNSFDEDKDIHLRLKKRKRELTLESKREGLLNKKTVLSERIKAMECEIDHLKRMHKANRNKNSTQTEDVSIAKQLASETKTIQSGDTLCVHGVKDGNSVIKAEKSNAEQTNGTDSAVQQSKTCTVL